MRDFIVAPYRHHQDVVREVRATALHAHVMHLRQAGQSVYSPIFEAHRMYNIAPAIVSAGLPAYWKTIVKALLVTRRFRVRVLMLSGWQDSELVQTALECAKRFDLPVLYETPPENLLCNTCVARFMAPEFACGGDDAACYHKRVAREMAA